MSYYTIISLYFAPELSGCCNPCKQREVRAGIHWRSLSWPYWCSKGNALTSSPGFTRGDFYGGSKVKYLGPSVCKNVFTISFVAALLFDVTCRSWYIQDAGEKEKNARAWLCRSDADYQDKLLACGAIIVAQLRVRVLEETQFTCSAGIAHNKVYNEL